MIRFYTNRRDSPPFRSSTIDWKQVNIKYSATQIIINDFIDTNLFAVGVAYLFFDMLIRWSLIEGDSWSEAWSSNSWYRFVDISNNKKFWIYSYLSVRHSPLQRCIPPYKISEQSWTNITVDILIKCPLFQRNRGVQWISRWSIVIQSQIVIDHRDIHSTPHSSVHLIRQQ